MQLQCSFVPCVHAQPRVKESTVIERCVPSAHLGHAQNLLSTQRV